MKSMFSFFTILFTICCTQQNGTIKEYYETGGLMKEYEMKNGIRNGYFKYYKKNGQLDLSYTNVNGERSGEQYTYYDNGKIKYRSLIKNQKTVWTEYYDEFGVLLNRAGYSEVVNFTLYGYYADTVLSQTTFMTRKYDHIKKDSLIKEVHDSTYYYLRNPNVMTLKIVPSYSEAGNQIFSMSHYNVAGNTIGIDSINNWEEMVEIRSKKLGSDWSNSVYKPSTLVKK